MADRIILEFEEGAEIIVEPVQTLLAPPEEKESGLVKAGLKDKAEQAVRWVRVKAKEVPTLPLVGLGKFFMATLPEPGVDDQWQVDEFSVEFELGLEIQASIKAGGQAGVQAGVQATAQSEVRLVVCPNGGFRCAFTWKRRSEALATQA